jgi:hypothetical protein
MKALPSPAGASPTADRQAILIVTARENAETLAASLASSLSMTVEIASTRHAALRLLDRRSFAVLILDQLLADSDPEAADLVWQHAGFALSLEINFALAGPGRVERELRAAMSRRRREEKLAQTAASAAIDSDLKNAVTGFLLESQLALAEPGIPPLIESHLRTLEAMAGRLRERLESSAASTTTFGGLPRPVA